MQGTVRSPFKIGVPPTTRHAVMLFVTLQHNSTQSALSQTTRCVRTKDRSGNKRGDPAQARPCLSPKGVLNTTRSAWAIPFAVNSFTHTPKWRTMHGSSVPTTNVFAPESRSQARSRSFTGYLEIPAIQRLSARLRSRATAEPAVWITVARKARPEGEGPSRFPTDPALPPPRSPLRPRQAAPVQAAHAASSASLSAWDSPSSHGLYPHTPNSVLWRCAFRLPRLKPELVAPVPVGSC